MCMDYFRYLFEWMYLEMKDFRNPCILKESTGIYVSPGTEVPKVLVLIFAIPPTLGKTLIYQEGKVGHIWWISYSYWFWWQTKIILYLEWSKCDCLTMISPRRMCALISYFLGVVVYHFICTCIFLVSQVHLTKNSTVISFHFF